MGALDPILNSIGTPRIGHQYIGHIYTHSHTYIQPISRGHLARLHVFGLLDETVGNKGNLQDTFAERLQV